MNFRDIVEEFYTESGDPVKATEIGNFEQILVDFYGHLEEKNYIHPDVMDVQKDSDGDEFYGEDHVDSTITVSNYLFKKGLPEIENED